MGEKYFPIKSESACQAKWSHNALNLQIGKTSCCCKVEPVSFTAEEFDNFHNLPIYLIERQQMINGERPARGCEICWDVDDSGGESLRQFYSKLPNLAPFELEDDPTATNVTPTVLTLGFNNACNLKCLYCGDQFSSQIYTENLKFGSFNHNGVVIENVLTESTTNTDIVDKFWAWLDRNYEKLRRIELVGGEPFFQKDLDRLLDFMLKRKNTHLQFQIVSNLAVAQKKINQNCEKIKQLVSEKRISRFELLSSIDCWGNEQEYVRSNLDLEIWKENFEYFARQKWCKLSIHQVISSLTIMSVPGLLDFVNMQKKKHNKRISQFLSNPHGTHSFLNLRVLGYDNLREIERVILSKIDDEQATVTLNGMFALAKKHKTDRQELEKMLIFLNEIDRRRETNWRGTFPWLVNIMEEQNVV